MNKPAFNSSDGTFESNRRSTRKRMHKIEDVLPEEPPKSVDHMEKAVALKAWFVRPTKRSTVYIEGIVNGRERGSGEVQNSSAVVRRLDARVLQTKTGSVYTLVGSVAVTKAVENGVSADFIRMFRNGFPKNWQSIVKKHYPDSASLKKKKRSMTDESNLLEVTAVSTRPDLDSMMCLSYTRSGRMRTVTATNSVPDVLSRESTVGSTFIEKKIKRRRTDKQGPDLTVTPLCPISRLLQTEQASANNCLRNTVDAACQTDALSDRTLSKDVGCQTELLGAVSHRDVAVSTRSVAVRRGRPKKNNGDRMTDPLFEVNENSGDRSSVPQDSVREVQAIARSSRTLRPRVPVVKAATTEEPTDMTSKRLQSTRPIGRINPSKSKPVQRVDRSCPPKPKSQPRKLMAAPAGRQTLRFRNQFREYLEKEARNNVDDDDDDDESGDDMFATTPYQNKCQIGGLASLRLNGNFDQQDDDDDGELLTPRQSLSSEGGHIFEMMPVKAQKTPNIHSGVTPFMMSVENVTKYKRDNERYIWARKKRLNRLKNSNVGIISPATMPTMPRFIDFSFPKGMLSRNPLDNDNDDDDDDDDEDADDYFSDDY